MFIVSYLVKSLLVVAIALFFLFSIFVAIKIYYEINRARRIDLIINDLTYWKSLFFLRSFVELKNLTHKNNKYQKLLDQLFAEYQVLISAGIIKWIETYLKLITNYKKGWLQLIESEATLKHHDKFRTLSTKITVFSNTVKDALKLENYCLDQVYKLRTIHDLMHDEINKTLLKVDFPLQKLKTFWASLESKVTTFETNIYSLPLPKLKAELKFLFTVFNRQIIAIINYLKLVLLYKSNLPELATQLVKLIATKLSGKMQNATRVWFTQHYESEYARLGKLLHDFNTPNLVETVFVFYHDLLTKKRQLEKLKPMQRTLTTAWHVFASVETQIYAWNKQLNHDIAELRRETYIFFYTLQGIEELATNFTIWKEKLAAWRALYSEQKDYIFLSNQFDFVADLITLTLTYLTKHHEILSIFQAEKERIELVILTILNLNTFLFKPHFRHFQKRYDQELKKIMTKFINLELNLRGKTEPGKVEKTTHQFDELEFLTTSLKEKIERQLVLLNITHHLFVINNRFRLEKIKIRNQMLNAEMLYLKGDYAKTIEQLVEIYEQK